MKWPVFGLAGLLLLTACHGHPAAVAPEDSALQQAVHSGLQSMQFDRPKQAIQQFRQAYNLALARDDASAIGDCGYDLAAAQLADDDAAASLQTALRTRDALSVRGLGSFAELDLAQAAALHRLGQDTEADSLAARAQATAQDPATVARASYVRGLIADVRGDQAGLAQALDGFGAPKHPEPDWRADHAALAARLALLRGDDRQAASLAKQAADIQRAQLHYRDMAASLQLAALAMQRAGLAQQAADLSLQARDALANQQQAQGSALHPLKAQP